MQKKIKWTVDARRSQGHALPDCITMKRIQLRSATFCNSKGWYLWKSFGIRMFLCHIISGCGFQLLSAFRCRHCCSGFVLCSAATATEALDMEGLGCLVFCAFFISDAFHTSKIVWINYFNSCKAFDHFPKEHEFHIFWKTNENLVGPWAFSNASKLCGSKTCLGFGSTLHQWARSLMQGDFLETSKSAGNAKFRAKLSKNSIRWHLYEGCSKFFHVEKDIFSFAEL